MLNIIIGGIAFILVIISTLFSSGFFETSDKNIDKVNNKNILMPINEEMCNKMPGMNGCEKFGKKDLDSKSKGIIIIKNNNQQLGELPMDEGKVKITFEIENSGTEDIILGEANGSCFCTQGYISNEDGTNKSVEFNTIGSKNPININRTIKSGEKQIVIAIYDPKAHGPNAVGPTTRGLTIKTNSKTTPNISLNFSGIVVKTRTKTK